MKKLVIFDLDGTLLNTIADLAQSTNHALEACGFPTHPVESYPHFVGDGINKLFERALPESERTEVNVLCVRSHFVPFYDAHNADLSTPYDGMVAVLSHLQAKGVKLAVASNKYQVATEKLVAHFFPNIQFDAVFGQRDGIPVKPNPAIVTDIIAITQVDKADILYVGDSGVDMQTACNSEIESVGVTWGFRPEAELVENNATHIVHQAADILKYIQE